MSFEAHLLLFFIKVFRLKKKLARRSFSELHEQDLREPTEKLRAKAAFEKVELAGVPCHWINKEQAAHGVLVYLHGGGYAFGPIEMQWEYITELALKTGYAALLIDFRQLPEYPFPAGLDDSVKVIAHLEENNALPPNWILVGDSSGGGLALATCYRLKEAHQPLPGKLVLLSPGLDLSGSNEELPQLDKIDPIISLAFYQKMGKAYAAQHDARDPQISPLFGELKGLPLLLLQVGARELLVGDCRKFRERCEKEGVQLQYEEYPGMFHVFPTYGFLPESKRAADAQVNFIRDKG